MDTQSGQNETLTQLRAFHFCLRVTYSNRVNDFKDKKRAADLKKRVSHKIDFKVLWPRNDHADSLVDKFIKMIKTLTCVGAILISTKKISKIFPKNVVSSQND